MQKPEDMLQMKHKKEESYDCNKIEDLYMQYIDNELDDVQKSLFEEHLEYCLPCDKKISFEMKLKEYIHSKAVNMEPIKTPKFDISKIISHRS